MLPLNLLAATGDFLDKGMAGRLRKALIRYSLFQRFFVWVWYQKVGAPINKALPLFD